MAVVAERRGAGVNPFNIRGIGNVVLDVVNPGRKQARERQTAIDQQLGKLRDELARPLLQQGTSIDRNTVAVGVIIDDYYTTYVTGRLITEGQTRRLEDITVYNPGVKYYKDRPFEAPYTSHEVIPQSGEPQSVLTYDEGVRAILGWSEEGDVAEMAVGLRRNMYNGYFYPAEPEKLEEFLASRRTPRELVQRSLDADYLRSIDVLLDRMDGKEPKPFVIFRFPAFGFKA